MQRSKPLGHAGYKHAGLYSEAGFVGGLLDQQLGRYDVNWYER